MLQPTRQLPQEGMAVRIFHFGGEVEHGTVVELHEDGRLVEVACSGDERLMFSLSPATAQFVAADRGDDVRMELIAEAEGL